MLICVVGKPEQYEDGGIGNSERSNERSNERRGSAAFRAHLMALGLSYCVRHGACTSYGGLFSALL